MMARKVVTILLLLSGVPVSSFFSFTNLLYRVHLCKDPSPGLLGCGPPVCHPGSKLPACKHHDDMHGGSNSGNSNSGSGGSSGSGGGSGASGSNSASGGGGSSSGGGGGGSSSGGSSGGSSSSGSGGSSSSGGGSSSSFAGYDEIIAYCEVNGGCNSLYSYSCDADGVCSYTKCTNIDDTCVYTCDAFRNCYKICEEGDNNCGTEFFSYYNGHDGTSKTGLRVIRNDHKLNTGRNFAILLVLLSVLAFGAVFTSSAFMKERSSNAHPLKGSIGKRMNLFARMAPRHPRPRDPALYNRTSDDGTIEIPTRTA